MIYYSRVSLYLIKFSCSIKDKEGEFRWFNGDKAQFSNFKSSEPNGGTKENCVYVAYTDGQWVDTECNVTMYKAHDKLRVGRIHDISIYRVPLCQFSQSGK